MYGSVSRNRCFLALFSRGLLIGAFFPILLSAQDRSEAEGELMKMKGEVNSEYEEFAPVLTLEENTLYFTSDRPLPGEKESNDLNLFVADRGRDGHWKQPEPLPFNSEADERSVATASSGQKLFFHREGDLFKVAKEDGEWGEPEPMDPAINSEHEDVAGSMSSDEEAFYFVSDRDGDRDIYRVKRLPTGEWSKAQKLPSPINTPEAENAPFIHPDDKTLFFSSEGHTQDEEADIFYSKKSELGEWSDPVNMGYPISTEGRNIHVMTSADGQRAYFSSREMKEEGDDRDLYRYDLKGAFTGGLAVLKGFIDVPQGSDLLSKVLVRIHRVGDSTEEERPMVQRPRVEDGIFIAVLPPCHDYELTYHLEDEKVLRQELFIPCRTGYQKIRKEVFLEPVDFDPSALDRRPSLIGKVQHESNGAPVSNGVLSVLGEEGNVKDSVSIGPKGGFRFYHPEADRKGLRFHFNKDGKCDNTSLEMRSGGRTLAPEKQEGCFYYFPDPR